MNPISIALAAASPLARAELEEGLRAFGVDVLLAAATFAELQAAGFAGAEVAVVDVAPDAVSEGAPGAADAEIDTWSAHGPGLVILADAGDERIGEWLIDGCAVLPRDASAEAVAAAAMALHAGLVATPPAYASAALRFERTGTGSITAPPAAPAFDVLTPRERQVLAAMSKGLRNREIGGELGISPHTAKFHVAQIIAKLEAQSRAHAVAKALKAGFVDA